MAVVVADAAARIAVTRSDDDVNTDGWDALRPRIEAVVVGGAEATAELAGAVVAAARELAVPQAAGPTSG
jgi:hypothetical protein